MAQTRGFDTLLPMALMTILLALRSSAQPPQPQCTPAAIAGFTPCIAFVTGNITSPSSPCCTQLQTQARCLCTFLSTGAASLGLKINQTQALTLPGACKIQAPPLTQCNVVAGAPPAASPEGAPGTAAPLAPTSPPSGLAPTTTPSIPSVPSSDQTPITTPSIPSVPSGSSSGNSPPIPSTPSSPSDSGSQAVPTTGQSSAAASPAEFSSTIFFHILLMLATCASALSVF